MTLPRSPDVVTVSRQHDRLALFFAFFSVVTIIAAVMLGAVVWDNQKIVAHRHQQQIADCHATVQRGLVYNRMLETLVAATKSDTGMPPAARQQAVAAYWSGRVHVPDCSDLDH